jgi:hypothetical protein
MSQGDAFRGMLFISTILFNHLSFISNLLAKVTNLPTNELTLKKFVFMQQDVRKKGKKSLKKIQKLLFKNSGTKINRHFVINVKLS